MNLKNILTHLSHYKACKLLGTNGDKLIMAGGKYEIDIDEQVIFNNQVFRLNLGEASVTISLNPEKKYHLELKCSECSIPCEHVGAALSLILEEKMILGLSRPPEEIKELTHDEIIEQAINERKHKAMKEKMTVKSGDKRNIWTDYIVTSLASGKTYRVALRGWERGESYCTCPDYKKNRLGICKHLFNVIENVKKRFSRSVKMKPYKRKNISVHVRYEEEEQLRLLIPKKLDPKLLNIAEPIMDKPVKDVHDLLVRIKKIEKLGHIVTIYPDAEKYINRILYLQRIENITNKMRKDPENHPLRKNLLKGELLPFQLDGIAFAVGRGRAVLADDMGLGKTIQGIGVAEMLFQEAGIVRVLVICPASLKSQWRIEIKRFTERSCQLVIGTAAERADQYNSQCFFTICNYEQVLRDITNIEEVKWDLIILDEGQRIKNWEAKTSRTVKSLRSPFALVLTGTPIENRLDDLYSIMEFVDIRHLEPDFRFFHKYKITDERGKPLGYKNLDKLREQLKPILLRRTRKEVMKDLPPRTTEIRRIPATAEQLSIDEAQRKVIQMIISKKYFTEMDLLRLQKAMLICRMAADSTYLVDKVPPRVFKQTEGD